jgi:xanthine dehydrogenase YagS FAD-binding subunit
VFRVGRSGCWSLRIGLRSHRWWLPGHGDLDGGVIRDVRLALGGVAHKPWRAIRAETALRGSPATVDSFRRAADAELADARQLPGNAFKVPLTRNTLVSVLSEVAAEMPR